MDEIHVNKGDIVRIYFDNKTVVGKVTELTPTFTTIIADEYHGMRDIECHFENREIDVIEKLAAVDDIKVDENYESEDKMVSHPDHYQSNNGLEVIDAIEAFTDGLNGIEATDTGNIIKYACRWHKKNGIQDLEKILWYTQHLINHLKKKECN